MIDSFGGVSAAQVEHPIRERLYLAFEVTALANGAGYLRAIYYSTRMSIFLNYIDLFVIEESPVLNVTLQEKVSHVI